MCKKEGEQIQAQRTIQEVRHEEPIQIHEAPQQMLEHEVQQEQIPAQFDQPVLLRRSTPAPEQAEPAQQQQLNRKERRTRERQMRRQRKAEEKAQRRQAEAQRKAERTHAKKMAAAKLKMDKMVKKMRASKDADTRYPDNGQSYAQRAEYLERVILTQVTDEEQSRRLLAYVQWYQEKAAQYDLQRRDIEFRQHHLPDYIQNVLHQEVTEEMRQQLARERQAFNDGVGARAEELYHSYETTIFRALGQEQQQNARAQSMVSGAQKEQYDQEITQRMERDHLTREEARNQRAEEMIRQRRPITLQKLEEVRKAHLNSEEFKEVEYGMLKNIENINDEIQKAFPGSPPMSWDEIDHQIMRPYLQEAMKNITYQLRVPNCNIMGLILDSGRFKTQIETGQTSGAVLAVKDRKTIAKTNFGVDPEALPPDQFEIYGYASHGDMVKESKPDSCVGQGVGQYGQIVVKLKKDAMKGRVTMSMGDSMDGFATTRPGFVDRPDLLAVSEKCRYDVGSDAVVHMKKQQDGEEDPVDVERLVKEAHVGYLELQYHGGLRVEDIESVTLIADYKSVKKDFKPETEMPPELVKRLKDLGIRATVVKDGEEHEL